VGLFICHFFSGFDCLGAAQHFSADQVVVKFTAPDSNEINPILI
jgi:hypothetical protein